MHVLPFSIHNAHMHTQIAAAEERERLKHMTEEERREWERLNPKVWFHPKWLKFWKCICGRLARSKAATDSTPHCHREGML